MANEITLTLGLTVSKGGVTETFNPGQKQFTMSGTNIARLTQTVGFAAAEVLILGDVVGAPGYILMHNLDATNYVEVFNETGATLPVVHLRPGGYALFEFAASATAPFVQANTGACKIEFLVVQL